MADPSSGSPRRGISGNSSSKEASKTSSASSTSCPSIVSTSKASPSHASFRRLRMIRTASSICGSSTKRISILAARTASATMRSVLAAHPMYCSLLSARWIASFGISAARSSSADSIICSLLSTEEVADAQLLRPVLSAVALACSNSLCASRYCAAMEVWLASAASKSSSACETLACLTLGSRAASFLTFLQRVTLAAARSTSRRHTSSSFSWARAH
mmetsp:Transcript_33454/g.87757  ORF Transcript_33454/g.87757 Transcript_33454/m.87757 type:complete len:217 (+) Transcript_33454:1360-2010(+)